MKLDLFFLYYSVGYTIVFSYIHIDRGGKIKCTHL